MNVIARLEYELTYYDFSVPWFNHYTTRTLHLVLVISKSIKIFRNYYYPSPSLSLSFSFSPSPSISLSLSLSLSLCVYIYDTIKRQSLPAVTISILQHGCTIGALTKRSETKLDKAAACCFQQILESTVYKTAVLRPLTYHLSNYPSKAN